MSRNQNSRFAENPTRIDMPRSTFWRDHSLKTSFNVGELVPFYLDEVLPGDTFEVKTSKVLRMPSLMTPIMDNIYLDTYYFFVPNRLVWEHWRELNGENTKSAWYDSTEYAVPLLTFEDAPEVGSLADYMGLPLSAGMSVNSMPFRAYAMICNEWFRNQNVEKPVFFDTGDATLVSNASKRAYDGVANSQLAYGGKPYKVYKYKDYFTANLPSPQKGPDVLMPNGGLGDIPVYARDKVVPDYDSPSLLGMLGRYTTRTDTTNRDYKYFAPLARGMTVNGVDNRVADLGTLSAPTYNSPDSAYPNLGVDILQGSNRAGSTFAPINLFADTNSTGVAPTINALRTAFQVQKLLERDARGGTRYREILKSHFGVTSPDARMQIPEYLGGNRLPLTIQQILQTSGTTATSPQGTPTGQSLTTDSDFSFKKSFVEHGFLIGVMCARYDHTYQQGIERFWSRQTRYDYYWPVFANLGEMGVKNKELYFSGTAEDDEIFGYQEAWADYRYKPNRITGYMRSGVQGSLDIWHLGDYYTRTPALSATYLREDGATIDRILAVESDGTHQIFGDIYVKCKATRCMPMYSVPGLIDHH